MSFFYKYCIGNAKADLHISHFPLQLEEHKQLNQTKGAYQMTLSYSGEEVLDNLGSFHPGGQELLSSEATHPPIQTTLFQIAR